MIMPTASNRQTASQTYPQTGPSPAAAWLLLGVIFLAVLFLKPEGILGLEGEW